MAFPDRLSNHVISYFNNRDPDVLPPMQLPEQILPGEGEAINFLKACIFLIQSFDDPSSENSVQMHLKIAMDPLLRIQSNEVVRDLSYKVEELLKALASGNLDISFDGDQEAQVDLDPDNAQRLELGYRIKRTNEGELTQLRYTFPQGTSFEIQIDDEAKKSFFAAIVSLAHVAMEVRSNPTRFNLDPHMEQWKIADGPTGLLDMATATRAGFMKLMNSDAWNEWQNF